MSRAELLASLELAAERKTFRARDFFIPVPKQMEFFNLAKSERMLMAGNGNGKTESAAYEVTCHLTGEYPPWWKGYRFNKPVRAWIAGTANEQLREGAQTKLLGPPGDGEAFGSGMIPREAFNGKPTPARGIADSIDSFSVKSKFGGASRAIFKTYTQKREDWQGADVDLVWFDEEPPLPIYTEGRTRLRGRGISLMTFTPLLGMSDVVCRFLEEEGAERGYVKMGIKDALWYTEQERQNQIDGYPAAEREARANGDPLLGSGKVYGAPADNLRIDPFPLDRVPLEWVKLWAIDFGIDHPFAAVLYAWDRDRDHHYILAAIRMSGANALQHAEAMRQIAANVPVAWPHDGHAREKGSGLELSKIYAGRKLNMLETHATHSTGGYSVYAGVTQLDEVMKAGRFHVDRTLAQWFEEYGQYHFKDGQIVKVRDDLLDATRIAWMMRRRAKAVPLGSRATRRRGSIILPGADEHHWGYE